MTTTTHTTDTNGTAMDNQPYYTTYGELAEGQQYRWRTDGAWFTRRASTLPLAGTTPAYVVQAMPLPPKPITVEIEADLLERVVEDSYQRSRNWATPTHANRQDRDDIRQAVRTARQAAQ